MVPEENYERLECGIEGVDEVLGGGAVAGSVVVVSGDPGAGKSTIMLQILTAYAKSGIPSVYVSGEESAAQVAARASRIKCKHEQLFLASLAGTSGDVDHAARMIKQAEVPIAVVDSLQVLRCNGVNGQPGGVNQVREATLRLIQLAKDPENPITIFLICHVTKDGDVAGPKTISHLVDAIVHLEAEEESPMRWFRIRGKNRFGDAGAARAFQMTANKGLVDLGGKVKRLEAKGQKRRMRRE